jgi:hypothetical protein
LVGTVNTEGICLVQNPKKLALITIEENSSRSNSKIKVSKQTNEFVLGKPTTLEVEPESGRLRPALLLLNLLWRDTPPMAHAHDAEPRRVSAMHQRGLRLAVVLVVRLEGGHKGVLP